MSSDADGARAAAEDTATAAAGDGDSSSSEKQSETDPDVLRAQVAVLKEENHRLRREYARARRVSYRRTARGLGVIGGIALAGAVLFPAVRVVLLVLGAIGLFGGVLTYYLTPERFVAATTGERIYASLDDTLAAVSAQLELTDEHVYVPVDGDPAVRLFVPAHQRYTIPDAQTLRDPLVVGDTDRERGIAVIPTGAYLFDEFERTLTGPFGEDAGTAAAQLADGLVESFELAAVADPDVDAADGRVTVAIEDSVYGGSEHFDNPLASFLAVGLAQAVQAPVSTVVHDEGSDGTVTVTCRWEPNESS